MIHNLLLELEVLPNVLALALHQVHIHYVKRRQSRVETFFVVR